MRPDCFKRNSDEARNAEGGGIGPQPKVEPGLILKERIAILDVIFGVKHPFENGAVTNIEFLYENTIIESDVALEQTAFGIEPARSRRRDLGPIIGNRGKRGIGTRPRLLAIMDAILRKTL